MVRNLDRQHQSEPIRKVPTISPADSATGGFKSIAERVAPPSNLPSSSPALERRMGLHCRVIPPTLYAPTAAIPNLSPSPAPRASTPTPSIPGRPHVPKMQARSLRTKRDGTCKKSLDIALKHTSSVCNLVGDSRIDRQQLPSEMCRFQHLTRRSLMTFEYQRDSRGTYIQRCRRVKSVIVSGSQIQHAVVSGAAGTRRQRSSH